MLIQEWVKAAQAGEEAAWNVLHRQYYPGLYTAALRICGNIPAAKDAVQDTFLIAFLKLSQLKDAATFGSWLKKILIHHCYRDSHRNQLNNGISKIPLESDAWWEDELNRTYDWHASQSQLYTAIAQLPEVLRSTLLLRFFSTFQSYEQMAAILCVPVGTIRSRLNQAKLKLTQQWQQYTDADSTFFDACEEWNDFYQQAYSGIHIHDAEKDRFMNHLQTNLQIVTAGGDTITGSKFFERKVVDDRQAGSWLRPEHIISCGNISIIEVTHYNSPEHPNHCPSLSVSVLCRYKDKVSKSMFKFG